MQYFNFGSGSGRAVLDLQCQLWNSVRHYLTNNEISLIEDLSSNIQSRKLDEIPQKVLSIVILNVIHRNTFEKCKMLFNDIQKNNNKTNFIDAVKDLTRFDLRETIPEEDLWIKIKEQDDKNKLVRIENSRIYNNIILTSYEEYYEKYKSLYGFTYNSPNKDNNNNYGVFLTDIFNNLKKEGIEADIKHPWDKIYENHNKINHKKRYEETFIPTIYSPKVSSIIKDLLNSELKDKYYELRIKYELKRFFLLGGITPEIILLDYVKCYGYEYLKRHLSETKWEEFSKELDRNLNENNGVQIGWKHMYSARYKNQNINLINLILENPYFHKNSSVEYLTNIGLNHEVERIKSIYQSPILHTLIDDFQVHEFINDKEKYHEYINSFAGPENEIRKLLGINEIGEGWVSETKLFYLIKENLKEYRIIQHGKPKWLGKQHLDIYIPDLNIGIEYQGKQHSMPLEIFGGPSAFTENQKRDKKKKIICDQNNCKLFEVFPEDDFRTFISTLQEYIHKSKLNLH